MVDDRMTWQEFENRLLDVLDEAMQVDNAACGKIRMVDPETGGLKICAHRGLSARFVEAYGVVDPEAPVPSARAYRAKRRVTIPDISQDPQTAPLASAAAEEGFKAAQATPIVAPNGDVVGTLSTHFPTFYHPSHSATLVLDYCAGRAAALIERFLGSER